MVKKINIISLVFLLFISSFDIFSQEDLDGGNKEDQKLNYVQVIIKLIDPERKAISGILVTISSEDKKLSLTGTTDSKGKTVIKVPPDNKYVISVPGNSAVSSINIAAFDKNIYPKTIIIDPESIIVDASSETISDTVIQHDLTGKKPEGSFSKVKIYLKSNIPGIQNTNIRIELYCQELKKVYVAFTQSDETAYFTLPVNHHYIIKTDSFDNADEFNVANYPGSVVKRTLYYVPLLMHQEIVNDTILQTVQENAAPTRTYALISVLVDNFEGKPLEGEHVYLNQLNGKFTYIGITDENGYVKFLIPKGKKYIIHFDNERNVDILDYLEMSGVRNTDIQYTYLGTKEIIRRQREKERLLRERDSIFSAGFAGFSIIEQYGTESNKARIKELIEKKALEDRQKILSDPDYFKKEGRVISEVLYRIGSKWKNKILITDITGSMYPYMDEILLWHSMQLVTDENKELIFFNDGDHQEDRAKKIGATGGLYYSPSSTLDQLLGVMKLAMLGGGGGDGPENDLEAILESKKYSKNNTEIILVADNYSDVKDISLLNQIDFPVHIIICGADYGINEDYLEIAYKTKGSVHTIEEDIWNLYSLTDNAEIIIKGQKYRMLRGKFYWMD